MTAREKARRRAVDAFSEKPLTFFPNAAKGPDLWSQYKNGIYFGSVLIGVLLPVFFLVVQP